MKIRDVIFFAHFEPTTDPRKSPDHRHRAFPPAVIINSQKESEIEKLMQKRPDETKNGSCNI